MNKKTKSKQASSYQIWLETPFHHWSSFAYKSSRSQYIVAPQLYTSFPFHRPINIVWRRWKILVTIIRSKYWSSKWANSIETLTDYRDHSCRDSRTWSKIRKWFHTIGWHDRRKQWLYWQKTIELDICFIKFRFFKSICGSLVNKQTNETKD